LDVINSDQFNLAAWKSMCSLMNVVTKEGL